MIINSCLKGAFVVLAGLVMAGTALAESAAQPNTTPQVGCGRSGNGAGPGMMGHSGYGPSAMGYGAGPGMMRGYGMGPGVMMPSVWSQLGLTNEQRTKINQIRDETRRSHWALMGSMLDQQSKLRDLYEAPTRDSAAIDSTSKTIDGVRQKMIGSSTDARKRIEAVLTKKQLEQLRTYQRGQDELGW